VVHAGPACPGGSTHGHDSGGDDGAHDGHDGGAHASGDHEEHGSDHFGATGDHHASAVAGAHAHGGPGHNGHHEPSDREGHDHRGRVEIATPRRLVGPPLTSQPPGTSTAVLALALAAVFGITGGWVLRVARLR
jgi:hypothetical protein